MSMTLKCKNHRPTHSSTRFDFTLNKKDGKDQESIQSSTTPDPGYQWESDNVTNRHHKREPRGQPFRRNIICPDVGMTLIKHLHTNGFFIPVP